jgi:hypothetical protein
LYAGDFEYFVKVNTVNPYVKEAVILSFDVNQSNHDIVLFFDFDIEKDPSYEAQRVNIQDDDSYHHAQIRYTYLIYPLQKGAIDIRFRLTQKATTDESVAYSFSGDRDNVKTLETKDSPIQIPPLRLMVKALPKDTKLVGAFSLDYTLNTHHAQIHEPIPLQIMIKGQGYPPILPHILPKHTDYKQFKQAIKKKSISNNQGTQNKIHYTMAISHTQSFDLEAIKIQAFDPKQNKSYILNIPKQAFNISTPSKSSLLDKENTTAIEAINWQWLKNLWSYLLVFVLGYTLAYFGKKISLPFYQQKQKHPLINKIEKAPSHKALLQILIAIQDKKYTKPIEALESVCYQKKHIKLSKIKKEAKMLTVDSNK